MGWNVRAAGRVFTTIGDAEMIETYLKKNPRLQNLAAFEGYLNFIRHNEGVRYGTVSVSLD